MAEWNNLFLLKHLKQQDVKSCRRHHTVGGKQLARAALDVDTT
jgi:hypothetical protein